MWPISHLLRHEGIPWADIISRNPHWKRMVFYVSGNFETINKKSKLLVRQNVIGYTRQKGVHLLVRFSAEKQNTAFQVHSKVLVNVGCSRQH
jgi:hypothetical protein